jgi:hypothetical protein
MVQAFHSIHEFCILTFANLHPLLGSSFWLLPDYASGYSPCSGSLVLGMVAGSSGLATV